MTVMPARLIEPNPADAAQIASWSTSAQDARWWCSRAEHPFPPDVVRSWWDRSDVRPYLLTTGLDGTDDTLRAVGYGELWLDQDEDEVELARLIVDPALRGRGLGRELVRLLLERAAATGLRQCFLRVDPTNDRAGRVYLAAGFRDVEPELADQWNIGQSTAFRWLHHPDFGRGDS
jgi:[ribosomal protein S18]-alanine N-acetyltransferase